MANKEWLKKGADGLSFGERLGDLIANNRTTATALARDTGLSQSAISDYLNKDRAPDCAAVCALARYFSVSAGDRSQPRGGSKGQGYASPYGLVGGKHHPAHGYGAAAHEFSLC